jgi:ATP:ADP antiporter, AAA family
VASSSSFTTSRLSSAVAAATLASATVTAQFVAGKATRDSLYLSELSVTSLPAMVAATAVFSIFLVVVSSRALQRLSPGIFVPLTFATSSVLLLACWILQFITPVGAAIVAYLVISGLGPMLGSGFWLIASERFDPRTAKKRFGQIAGGGTIGGLAGGLLSERVAAIADVPAVLVALAFLNLMAAWQIRSLSRAIEGSRMSAADISPELAATAPRSGLRVLGDAPYLRSLAALVFLGTLGAALLDYVFKTEVVAAFGSGDALMRFFAVFYAGTSLVTFVFQVSASRMVLEKLGLAITTATPSLALFFGGILAVLVPGVDTLGVGRGAESIFRGSLFRSGYELFYTPIPAAEKRAAKSLIDVGFDRFGEAVGGGLILLALLLPAARQSPAIMGLAIVSAAAALFVASRLNRGYIHTLERSLLNRALELDLADTEDSTTRTAMMRSLSSIRTFSQLRSHARIGQSDRVNRPPTTAAPVEDRDAVDKELLHIMELRSRDRDRVLSVLKRDEPIAASLVPHVIPLLAWDPVANDAVNALRRIAEERVGELIDALVDPRQDFAIRRRLARVFAICVSQRAADGLMLALEDLRFEVRFQAARSLVAILERNPRLHVDSAFVFEVVEREVAVGRPVWEAHRLLTGPEEGDPALFLDEYVRDRASRSLAHVFTLLSLVLPPEPLRIAFRGLHTDDYKLRGTALEYLEGVLPPQIRARLWPFLDESGTARRPTLRSREEILGDLLRSNQSIVMNLEELNQHRRPDSAESKPAKGA